MSTPYTREDVFAFFDEPLTPKQADGVVRYLNEGVIPPADPCQGCEPNKIRKLINAAQREQHEKGDFPRVQGVQRMELHNEFVPAAEGVSGQGLQEPEDINEIQRAEVPGEYVAAQPGEVVTDRAPRKRKASE